jgi:protein subunit release factor B
MAEAEPIAIAAGGRSVLIPADALEWRFARASGPGGQHVNRTSSKAQWSLCFERPPSSTLRATS